MLYMCYSVGSNAFGISIKPSSNNLNTINKYVHSVNEI